MKTAMQKLWDVLNDAEQNGVYEIGTQNFKRYIEGIYLEMEKQQINACFEKAYMDGYYDNGKSGYEYYDSTFGDSNEAGI